MSHIRSVDRATRTLILLWLGLAGVLGCMLAVKAHGQNVEGQIIASQYGTWKVPGYSADTYVFSPTACRVQGGASFFQAFSVGIPIQIVDGNPSLSEVVTPSQVVANSSACSIAIHPANHHEPPFYLTSATGGLQEAINANLAIPGPNTIILNNAWYQMGGSAAIIASVQGSSSLGLVDITQTPSKWYQWNGSQYVAISNTCSTGSCVTQLNALTGQVQLSAGQNISITPSGQTLTVSATSGVTPASQYAKATYTNTGSSSVVGGATSSVILPPGLTTSQINSALSSNVSATIQPTDVHTPFSNTLGADIEDERMDVPARAVSFKALGGQCDTQIAYVTFTPGSNQATTVNFVASTAGGFYSAPQAYVGATLAVGWIASDGTQWAWEPTVTGITNTWPYTITLNEKAPSNITTFAGYVTQVGHDDTAAFNAIASLPSQIAVEFPAATGACMTHTVTISGQEREWLGKYQSQIVGFPGEDVLYFDGTSSDKFENLKIEYNGQIDATKAWTLIDSSGNEYTEIPKTRYFGQGTSWGNNPTYIPPMGAANAWTGQTLEANQASTDNTITVTHRVVAYDGDRGYNGTGPYGCVKIDSEYECYENWITIDPNISPSQYDELINVQRGMFGTTPAAHTAGATITPVDMFSPATPYITAGTEYNFQSITLQRTSNVVTVTLPSSTTVFGASGAEITIYGTGTGDFAGTFNVASASGTTVTYDQTGTNEGPTSAPSGWAILAGPARPVIWPVFEAGNAAIATDSYSGITGPYAAGSLFNSRFYHLIPGDYTPTFNTDYEGTNVHAGGVWFQGPMYQTHWEDVQINGVFGFLHVPPSVDTNWQAGFDNETNTFTKFDIHSGLGFVLNNESNGQANSINDYSEEPLNPVTDSSFPGIGPSMFPVCNDQTGVCNAGNAFDWKWSNIYSEPSQYTTQWRMGAYEEYWENDSEFDVGVYHLNNSGWTIFHGDHNRFNSPNFTYSGGAPQIFIYGDANEGNFSLAGDLTTSLSPGSLGYYSNVMDEGEHNVCTASSSNVSYSVCRGIVRDGGLTGDWLSKGASSVAGLYPNNNDLIISASDLINGGSWGTGSYEGIDMSAPGSFAYAAQPYSAFNGGNIRPHLFATLNDIGTRFPSVHGTLYFTAKASVATNETFHAYYSGGELDSQCGGGTLNYIDSSGSSAGITEALTTSWQVFSFGVNLQDAPGRTGTSPTSGCYFAVGDDTPSVSGAQVDVGYFQFVPDTQSLSVENLNIENQLLANGSAGTSGQVLTSQGAGMPPVWAAGGGGGGGVSLTSPNSTLALSPSPITGSGALDINLSHSNTWTAAQANSAAGAASTAAMLYSGAPYAAGTATTNVPLLYLNDGTGPASWSTAGTEFGINAASGFTGNFFDFHLNGGNSLASLNYEGNLTAQRVAVGNGAISSGNLLLGSGQVSAWSSTTGYNGTLDTGLSRASAGVVDVGNGTAGNASGSMDMAGLTVNGVSGSTQCLQANSSGVVSGTGSPCGGTITIASGTASLGTSAIASGSCATTVTVAASGVLTTDTIMADFNSSPLSITGYEPSASGILTIYKWPTAGDVNFAVCNTTANSITPGAVTLNWRVVR